jgi:hypothetical protein
MVIGVASRSRRDAPAPRLVAWLDFNANLQIYQRRAELAKHAGMH